MLCSRVLRSPSSRLLFLRNTSTSRPGGLLTATLGPPGRLLLFAPPVRFLATSSDPRPRRGAFVRRRRVVTEQGEDQQQPSASSSSSSVLLGTGGVAATLLLLGGKAKSILLLLKLTKLSSVLSLLASSGAYAMVYGWPFAITMVSHLLVHESGHALMMHRYGMSFSPMVFIPFMGAVVGQERPSNNGTEEVNIALAGPLAGGLFSVGMLGAGLATHSNFLLAAADFGLTLNLFNLVPVLPLDGGRASSVLSPWLVAGGSALWCTATYTGAIVSPMAPLIALASVWGTYQAFFGEGERFNESTSGREKVRAGASYMALILGLMAAQQVSSRYRKSPQQLRKELGQPPSAVERSLADFIVEDDLESQDPWLGKKKHL